MTSVEEIKRAIQRLNLDGWFEVQDCASKLIESRTLTTEVKEPQAAYEPNPPWMTFEQYLEFAWRLAGSYAIMRKGSIVSSGATADLRHDVVRQHLTV